MSCMETRGTTAIGRDQFIVAMRAIANTVAVVTTGGTGGMHGATVSSFCSVSADPPSMLVCLHANSRIAALVAENGNFCLNVLPQEHTAVADRFAGKHDPDEPDRFAGIEHTIAEDGCPYVVGSIALHCRVGTRKRSGSHLVVIGEVINLTGSIARPLTYMDGAYRPWIT